MADNFTLGMDCKLLRGDALLDEAGPSGVNWTEIDNAKDVTLNLETGETDITTRGNNGWRATAATLKDGSVEFEMLWKPSDSAFAAIQNAWANSVEIALAILDAGIDTGRGLVSNFTITNFSRNEPLEEAVTVSVTAKPSSYTQWQAD